MKFIVIDPVIADLGFVKVYWYGVMYLIAFLSAYLLAKYRCKFSEVWNVKHLDDLIFFGALGAVLGGRLGYLLFYNWSIFISNPLTFFNFQNGGMSFHGGFLGVLLAMMLFNKKHDFSMLVRQKDDVFGRAKYESLTQRFNLNEISYIKRGVIWNVNYKSSNLENEIESILTTNIFYNPNSYEYYRIN